MRFFNGTHIIVITLDTNQDADESLTIRTCPADSNGNETGPFTIFNPDLEGEDVLREIYHEALIHLMENPND